MIDGDLAIYMAAAAAQVSIDLDDGLGDEPIVDTEQAVQGGLRLIDEWRRKAGADRAVVCLSTGHNFRKTILPTYKANRTAPKPLAYQDVLEAVELEYETWSEPGLEADDVMGIAATGDRGDFVIVSRDKDMKTLPAKVFNPDHDTKPVRIRVGMADQMWMKQTICGDPTDGYAGIPGLGAVAAQDMLLNPHRLHKRTRTLTKGKNKGQVKVEWEKGEPCGLWPCMVDYATKAGMTEQQLITMARVSRILRAGDFDKERRVVRLWKPNGYEELQLVD